MAALFTSGKFQAINALGVVPGAKLYTYAAGGLTPLATFTDQGGGSENTNPVVCNADGQANVWLGVAPYRMILKDASDVTIYDVDNITTATTAGEISYDSSTDYEDGTVGHELNNTVWADVKSTNTGVQNDEAVLAAAAICQSRGGGVVMLPPGNFPHISIAWDTETYPAVSLRGSGKSATYLTKSGITDTPVLDVSGTTLAYGVSLSDFSITGNTANVGLQTTLLARFTVRSVLISSCLVGWDNYGSLIGSVYDLDLQANATGYRQSRSTGTVVYPNLITFYGGQILSNTAIGFDIVHGTGTVWDHCDVELNGVLANAATNGIRIRSTTNIEQPYGSFEVRNCWFEANYGIPLKVEAADHLIVLVTEGKFYTDGSTQATTVVDIGAIESATLVNCSGVVGTALIAASRSVVTNSIFHTLTDTSTNYTHTQVATNAGFFPVKVGGTGAAVDVGGSKLSAVYTIADANPSSVTTSVPIATLTHAGCMVLISGRITGSGVAYTRLYLVAVKVGGGAAPDLAAVAVSVAGDTGATFTFSNDSGFMKITQATGNGGYATVIGG